MTDTTSLPCRLACACNCAYAICVSDGKFHVRQPYFDGVHWDGTPQAFSAAAQNDPVKRRINACLVGNVEGVVDSQGDDVFVAFRGTLPPALTIASFEDWWQDIVDSTPSSHPPIPGKVHSGFWNALDSLWDMILPAIKDRLNDSSKLYITGHSKGGPLATLAAARLHFESGISATEVITFASPHPGDVTFVEGFPLETIPVIRYENYLDIVPFLPPTAEFFKIVKELESTTIGKEFCSYVPTICGVLDQAGTWNYASLGTLRYIESNGTVVGTSSPYANPYLRLFEIAGYLFDFERIAAAHCIACKAKGCAGGYTGAACAGTSLCDGTIDPDPCQET